MASIIKADNIQKVSDGSNIIKKCGSTITLGSCGATISLAAGATQTGFGRTGTVDWCTTAKTSPFTGVSGKGYFVNTSCGAVTVTLPATPTAGDIVSLKDYGNTWQTNALSVCNNGSKINGVCATTSLSTQGQSVTLIYVDATKGWQDINDSTSSVTGTTYMSATGGTITTSGDYKIHTFTADGCFIVSTLSNSSTYNEVSYIVVAGGGGGGKGHGGGGGAGGFRENKSTVDSYTASPLNGSTPITVTATTYPISVGAGGTGSPASGCCSPFTNTSGSNSVFSTITSSGGGKAAGWTNAGATGGSGGGGGGSGAPQTTGYTGNTPPTNPSQGSSGGNGTNPGGGGGGGGATVAGSNSTNPGPAANGGAGGNGATTSISGTPASYAGGGGGGNYGAPGVGGTGGSGGGGNGASVPGTCAAAGTANTGGGGGGGGSSYNKGAAGGSGIVIIRYKYQ